MSSATKIPPTESFLLSNGHICSCNSTLKLIYKPSGRASNCKPGILNLETLPFKLANGRLYLSRIELNFVHRAGIGHQAACESLQLKNTASNQMALVGAIPVLWITPPPLRKKGDSEMVVHDNDVIKNKGGVGLSAVYAAWTFMELNHDGKQITEHKFIHDIAKDSYCWQVSAKIRLKDLHVFMIGIDCIWQLIPSMGQFKR